MKIISIANQKGGVGKTTISVGMAGVLSEMKKKVLLVDMDQQGNLSSSFIDHIHGLERTVYDVLTDDTEIGGVIHKTDFENISILPANLSLSELDYRLASDYDAQFNLLEALNDVKSDYDFIIIDCPPNLSLATRMALIASDGLIMPIECQEWAVRGSSQLEAFVEKVKKRANPKLKILGFVINKYQANRAIESGYNQALREKYPKKIFQTEFANNVQYTEAATARKPINYYLPGSKQADAFREFVKEVLSNV